MPDGITVQLIHETFRAYLLECNRADNDFVLDNETIDGNAALDCLEFMSSRETEFAHTNFTFYASKYWMNHLAASSMSSPSTTHNLLIRLQMFFQPEGLTRWVKDDLVPDIFPASVGAIVTIEDDCLKGVENWLRRYQNLRANNDLGSQEILNGAIKWMRWVLNHPQDLGNAVGKAAANVWLSSDTSSFVIQRCCLLALKYYWGRNGELPSFVDIFNG